MNKFQTDLFNDLEHLVSNNEAFYKQSFELDGLTYWIYNYRLASYTDFLHPNALNCRGTMFEVDAEGNPIRLAALPIEKFFNVNEVSSDINTLAEALVRTGRLSEHVYNKVKK